MQQDLAVQGGADPLGLGLGRRLEREAHGEHPPEPDDHFAVALGGLQLGGLVLAQELRGREDLRQAVTGWLDRIFSPLVTLWVFLGQVLGADHSCRAAVARLITHRLAQGRRACSAETGAYCQARQRLPESFFADVACQTGRALEAAVDSRWL